MVKQNNRQIACIGSYCREVGVVIRCAAASTHSALVRVLDACTREGFADVVVASPR